MNGSLVQMVQFWSIDSKIKCSFQYISINTYLIQDLLFFQHIFFVLEMQTE